MTTNNTLDRVFPPNQSIPEETLKLAEDILGMDIVKFFKSHGPHDSILLESTHIESPFTWDSIDCFRGRVAFDGLYSHTEQLAELRLKLPK